MLYRDSIGIIWGLRRDYIGIIFPSSLRRAGKQSLGLIRLALTMVFLGECGW